MFKTQITFSEALMALKEGRSIARQGWNGKKMHLWLKLGGLPPEKEADDNGTFDGIMSNLFEPTGEDTVMRLPCICMKVASGAILEGWLASQTDMLATDWCVLSDGEVA